VTIAAAQPGSEILAQTYAAPTAGRYLITVSGLDDTLGTSTLTLYANAALETEPRGGGPNNDIAHAQNIDVAFASIASDAFRAGVIGTTEQGSQDYYAFTLLPGETAGIAVAGQTATGFTVDLFDSAGNQLAAGISAINVNQVINYFKPSTGGTYLARVSGTAASAYSLIVTRNSLYELEN